MTIFKRLFAVLLCCVLVFCLLFAEANANETQYSHVVIHPNGGIWNGSDAEVDSQYPVGSVISLGKATRDGYDFVCWTLDYSGSDHIIEPWGTPMHSDPSFTSTTSDIGIYNDADNLTVTLERVSKTTDCPTSSGNMLQITATGTANPGLGGFAQATTSKANGVFYHIIIAKIPVGCQIQCTSDSVGDNGVQTWLTSQEGTGRFEAYIYQTVCGSTGTFHDFGYVYLNRTEDFADNTVTWYVGYSEIFDGTDVSGSGTRYTVGVGEGILHAVWKTHEYTVTYDSNGGSGAPAAQKKYHDINLALSTVEPTKQNTITYDATGGSVVPTSKTLSSQFTAWNTAKNGTDTSYVPGDEYAVNEDLTLYAQWSNPKAGALPVPEWIGHTFSGWYTERDDGTEITEESEIDSNITLFAHWTNVCSGEHDYQAVVTPPTCIEQGYTTLSCVVCGYSTIKDYLNPLGHDWSAWTAIQPPTISESGLLEHVCIRCNETEQQEIPAGSGFMSLSSELARPSEEVMVSVNLQNNPGICAMILHLDYDTTRLNLIGFEDSGLTGWSVIQNAVWLGERDSDVTGEILKLRFKVLDDAEKGAAFVNLSYEEGDIANYNEELVRVFIEAGIVTVYTILPGDINGDGKVNSLDFLRMKRYLSGQEVEIVGSCDVNGDGRVNALDLIRMKRYLAGENVEIF